MKTKKEHYCVNYICTVKSTRLVQRNKIYVTQRIKNNEGDDFSSILVQLAIFFAQGPCKEKKIMKFI